jgi:hypothetical protein
MSRFEKRISDEQIAEARQKIAAGMTLRAAAAEIPCAASTLSYRITRVEKQEEESAVAADRDDPLPLATQPIADGHHLPVAQVGPLEVLREALQATKKDGQPDWSTRLAAARALGTLRPQELEPKPASKPLQPGSSSTTCPLGPTRSSTVPSRARPRRPFLCSRALTLRARVTSSNQCATSSPTARRMALRTRF